MSDASFEKDGLIYREMTEADIPKLMAFADIFLRSDVLLLRTYITHNLRDGHAKVWIVFDDQKLIGFAFVFKSTNSLNNLYVHPKYRGKQIGTNLIQFLKPKIVRSKVDQTTGDPSGFYKKIGYEIVAERQGKKRNLTILQRIDKNYG